jgi:adenylate cyclase
MDLDLPIIDGWEATRRLKTDPATREIPIIAVTAHALVGSREQALAAGCDEFDTKPVQFEGCCKRSTPCCERKNRSPRQVRDKVDVVFEDAGDQHLKNIERPVRVYRLQLGKIVTPAEKIPASTNKPSIAVLPFQNMSGDPEQEYFADGMVEEIITALSRIRWLFVIARNSSFTYKGQAIDVKRVGRELGVRYVLEGSVRKGRERVRITAQLIEAETGAHLWADHFDGLLEDVFELQDKVASGVAGVIEPTLQIVEVERASRRPTNDLAAYDLYLRAYALMLSPARRIPEVLDLLDQAIERDPNFGLALAWAAISHFLCDLNSWSDDREDNWRKGLKCGRQALQVAGDDPAILANAAFALSYFGEDGGAMMALVDRALSFNSSFARGWHCSGGIRLIAGLPDLAIQHFENALRLSPRARVGWSVFGIGLGHFASKRFEEALPKLLFAMQEDANFPIIYRYLAACYAHLGRLSEARETVERLRAICPTIGIDSYLRKPEHHELYLSGLRLATGES